MSTLISFEAHYCVYWFWGHLGDSSADQYQMLPVTDLGLPVWSYKVIHSLWLPLMDLVCMGGAKLYTKATSTIIEPWGKVINRPKYLQTWLHLPVPANCLLETLSPGSLAVCEMNDILSESTGRCDLCSD